MANHWNGKKIFLHALAVWHSGHRVRLQNRRSRVRIPPGCKVFRALNTLQFSKLIIYCTYCVYLIIFLTSHDATWCSGLLANRSFC
jgi:hypothetical protein